MTFPSLIDAVTPLVALMMIAPMLVWYAVNKRYRKDRRRGLLPFLEANRIEILLTIMFVAIAAPDWGRFIFGIGGL